MSDPTTDKLESEIAVLKAKARGADIQFKELQEIVEVILKERADQSAEVRELRIRLRAQQNATEEMQSNRDDALKEVERTEGAHAELWAERNGYEISAKNALKEVERLKAQETNVAMANIELLRKLKVARDGLYRASARCVDLNLQTLGKAVDRVIKQSEVQG